MTPFKWLVSSASVVTAVTILIGAVSWAADTKYFTIESQEIYVQEVSAEQSEGEIRQLKRDIKRLELKDENGNASPEDRAFVEYLQQDLEALQQTQ